jgi:Mannosyltransferase (PIG-V)
VISSVSAIAFARGRLLGSLQRTRTSLRPYDTYLLALLVFSASRLVVLIGINFGTMLQDAQNPGAWNAGTDWYFRLLRWDSGWYASIVDHGYSYSSDPSQQASVVFYPLYPLASYLVTQLGIDVYVALLIVANAAAVISVLLLAKLAKDLFDDQTAVMAVALFSFFPSSHFLSAGYSEPLYLVFALLSLHLVNSQNYVLASLFAGLSLGTRSTGIVLLPTILWDIVRRTPNWWPRTVPKLVLCTLLCASGLIAFMAYLGWKFGDPLAFAKGQAAWNPGTFADRFISGATLQPFLHARWMASAWFLLFLTATIASFWRLPSSLSLYGLGALMLPYLTLGITDSTNRFLLTCIPAFIYVATLCKSTPWLACIIVGILGSLLLRDSALFSEWYFTG